MTPRLPLLPLDESRRIASEVDILELAADLSIFRIWLRHPALAKRLNDLLMGLLWEGKLDTRLRELVIMRLGWATGSDYEWTQHWRIALGVGVDEADLLAVRDWRASDRFGDAERAVLAATDETVEHGAISAATWQACRTHVSDDPKVLLELVTAIGLWRMVSGVLRSLEVPLEDGVASWPPDGEGPA